MKSTPFKVQSFGFMAIGLSLMLSGCKSDPDSPGLEYMPDMYRSPAVEAYVDYENLMEQSVKLPPVGTMPYTADEEEQISRLAFLLKPDKGMDKSHGWYGYEFAEENAYQKARELKSPLPPTDVNLEKGKALYSKFCTQCHGEKGDGQGKIVQNGKIEGIPAYNTLDITEGQMFFSITYGKGLMGAHASFMSPKERWQLVMYVNALKNGGKYPEANEGESSDEGTDGATIDDNETAEQVN